MENVASEEEKKKNCWKCDNAYKCCSRCENDLTGMELKSNEVRDSGYKFTIFALLLKDNEGRNFCTPCKKYILSIDIIVTVMLIVYFLLMIFYF